MCVHGNEVDDWNVTDHETIRRYGRDLQQGRSVTPWIPNAGTHLVIEVMNDIKRRYPFVDLLKPELQAVIPVLLAIAPDKRDRILGAFPVLKRLTMDKMRRATGLLGAEDWPEDFGIAGLTNAIRRPPMNYNALMMAVEDRVSRDVEPMSLVPDVAGNEKLGGLDAAWNWVRGKDARDTLRMALESLQKDRSFEWSQQDDTFSQLDEMIGADVDFLLAGHTHLERALRRRKTNGYYLNSGTWARLIRLEAKFLTDSAEFANVYAALAAGSMTALDQAPGLVMRRRTVVAIRPSAAGTRGELLHWTSIGSKFELAPIDPQAGMTKV